MPSYSQNEPPMEAMDDQAGQATESLQAAVSSINFAEKLDDQELVRIGMECGKGLTEDLGSRELWDRHMKAWTELATQVTKAKTFPWPNASNVKYPLISTAAMQFSARAYPALVPANGQVVTAKVVGKDPTGEKGEQAIRVSSYMSYQVMNEVCGWEEGMDKLLIMLPVVGMIFKKTYWCSKTNKVCSDVLLPKEVVVNYWTRTLKDCERISHIVPMSRRLVEEKQRNEYFLEDAKIGDPPTPEAPELGAMRPPSESDVTTPFEVVEQHTYLTLGDDKFPKPYIVTFLKHNNTVLRIEANWTDETTYKDDEGNILCIEPVQYFTKFGFIPNPDGSFYDMGFGTLLGPLNEAINTLINQLVDSGTLNNMNGGFLGKGLRLKLGETAFTPGEWKSVNATGNDLKQQILPLPTKEPSAVLFQLMGALIQSGKELASVAEIFTGKMPGQNTPATTTMATVEQGMKVFTAVYKRIYRSLGEEFQKIYRLNGLFLNPHTYSAVLDTTIGPDDFKLQDGTYNVLPGADPSASSQQEKQQKAQMLMGLLQVGPILDPVKVVTRLLEAAEVPDYESLLSPQVAQTGQLPPPPPDPKMMESKAKIEAQQQSAQIKMQETQQKMELQGRSEEQKMAMQAQAHQQEMAMKRDTAILDTQARIANDRSRMQQDNARFNQQMIHGEQNHQQALRQQSQSAANKPQPKGGKSKK